MEQVRIICRDGIHFQNAVYWSDKLTGLVGLAVYIRYDTKDVSKIDVIRQNKHFCTAYIREPMAVSGSYANEETQTQMSLF